jgi:hypothetical protein
VVVGVIHATVLPPTFVRATPPAAERVDN